MVVANIAPKSDRRRYCRSVQHWRHPGEPLSEPAKVAIHLGLDPRSSRDDKYFSPSLPFFWLGSTSAICFVSLEKMWRKEKTLVNHDFLVGGAGEKRRGKRGIFHVYGLFRRTVQGRFLGKEKQLIKRMSKVETPNFYQFCRKVCDFMSESVCTYHLAKSRQIYSLCDNW